MGGSDDAQAQLKSAAAGEIELTPDQVESLMERINTPIQHRDVIAKALREGQPVPDSVLKEYPDLQKVVQAEPVTTPQSTEQDARARAQQEEAAADAKAQADEQVGDFDLTGSNRPADVAAAAGQNDMFGLGGAQDDAQAQPVTIPEPQSVAEVEALPEFTVYRNQSKYLVRGNLPRGGGDTVHATLEAAQEEASIQKRRAESRQKREADQAQQAEQDAQAVAAEKADTLNGFTEGMKPIEAGRTKKNLRKQMRFDGEVMTLRERIESWSDAGTLEISTIREPKIKPMTRTQFNRATQAEQDAHERKMREAGDKTVYLVNGVDMGKTAYEYASHLASQNETAQSTEQEPVSTEQAEPEAAGQPASTAEPQAEPVDPELTESAVIEDVGEKLGRARKDELRTARERLANMDDEQIASSTLSKLWPKSEIDKIEDPVSAAIYHTARNMMPNKPRIGYKLKRWVDQVKQARDLLNMVDEIGSDKFIQSIRDKRIDSLQSFADKVELLTGVDRSHWDRIGRVEKASGTYREGEEMVSGSWMLVEIDKRMTIHRGASEVSEIIAPVNAQLEKSANTQPAMKFEIRHDRRHTVYKINKAGDNEQRPLKTFDTLKEARDYLRNNNADLVEAWEAVKQRDNVTKADMRGDKNRERTGQDYRGGRDVSAEEFIEAFGFRGAEFGNWVKQGKAGQERQGLLNDAYDAFMDLANVLGLPPKALSFEGRLGIGFGSRGKGGRASAHFEPDLTVINLTKTKGAGSLAHEWFHALDNYFSRKRGDTEFNGDQKAYREGAFVTYRPEPMMAYKPSMKVGRAPYLITRAEYNRRKEHGMGFEESQWIADPDHPKGIRPEVEKAFAELVNTLNASPMMTRAQVIDKGKVDGYWSQIIERAARSFETHIIAKLAQKGYRNDFLANVTSFEKFKRNPDRYPYLKPEEQGPVTEAFDKLFDTIETRTDEAGNVALFRREGIESVVTSDAQPAEGMKVEDVRKLAQAFMDAYNGNIPLEFRVENTQEELYGEEGSVENIGVVKGAYLPKDGVFTLAARNLSEMGDAVETIRHEVLGHYGLNTFTPADKRRILDQLIEARDSEGPLADTWAEIDELYADKSDDIRAEEVFAKVVESEPAKVGKLKAFVDRLLYNLNAALRRAGIIKAPMKMDDVRRMARYVAEGIRAGRRQQQIFPETNDALFRRGGSNAPDAFTAPEETWANVALRKMADKFQVLKDLQKNIKDAGGTVNESNDAYLAEELFHGKTEEDLRQMRETFIKPLADKMAKFGIEQKGLDQYLYAKHASGQRRSGKRPLKSF